MASPVTAVVRAPGSVLGRVVAEGRGIWTEGQAFAHGRDVDGSARELTSEEMSLAWLAGLATVAAARLVTWPQAGLVAALHLAEHSIRDRRIEEYLQGLETGA